MRKKNQTGSFSGRGLTERVKTARKRSVSSTRWLERQLNDPYVAEARKLSYRSRAAFKILEIDRLFKLFFAGRKVIDLGSAPGSWSQIAAESVNDSHGTKGCVVAMDLLPMEPIAGVIFLQMDFLDSDAPGCLRLHLGGDADVVMSDMAANATGHRQTDHLKIIALCESALSFARDILAPGGIFVAKVLQGGTEAALLADMKRDFAAVKHVKPKASRSDSAEMYVVATGFRAERAAERDK